jgi:hypothetical protein
MAPSKENLLHESKRERWLVTQWLLGSLAAGAGLILPWDFPRAQGAASDEVLNIAYISDVATWDPTAITVPQAQSVYEKYKRK